MKENLPKSLEYILEDEGSELNLGGSEPGGGSKYGVSMTNLVDWNVRHGLPTPTIEKDLAGMTPEFASQIYTETFARPMRFDDLPSGVDYRILEASVNLGLVGGIRLAQSVLWLWQETGVMDDITIAALKIVNPELMIRLYGAAWIGVKRQSENWNPSKITKTGYGHGWTNRAMRAQSRAIAMIRGEAP